MLERYDPASYEAAWRAKWKEADVFKTREEEGRQKFYGLDFFPYPSGAGLSVGHCRNYIPTDVLCRMKYMQGYNVLHPMGFDAFGLPAENEAIKKKRHPAPMIGDYSDTYQRQMELIGIGFDWSRSFKSSDPSYYKWTQWIFTLLYEKGLAYRKLAAVNWDPVDQTVLADEEIIGGRAERSGAVVEKKWIPQWYFKITAYADRLIDDLDSLDWPEGIKHQQKNWIGRSRGVEFEMRIDLDAGDTEVSPVASLESAKELAHQGAAMLADTEMAVRAEELVDCLENLDLSSPDLASQIEALGEMADELEDFAEDLDNDEAETIYDSLEELLEEMAEDKLEVIKGKTKPVFRVFTTRIDTLFGVTFCVLAPEHPQVEFIKSHVDSEFVEAISAYQEKAKAKTDDDRTGNAEKTGVFTGAYAVNPGNGKRVPIYIADYVLMGYGTGAIMAVPAHDQRDFDFAMAYGLDVIPVCEPDDAYLAGVYPEKEYDRSAALAWYSDNVKSCKTVFLSKESTLFNSGEYSGMNSLEAAENLGEWFEACEKGERKTNYKLRDWLISRQRYWGCPIPIVYDKEGNEETVPVSGLPVELPDVENYEPSSDGSSPLARIPEFLNCTTREGSLGTRETDTMSGFACSSWYFLRFCDPHNQKEAWNLEKAAHWMPVDCYVGGAEHAVMHLLYARFWCKFLYDQGLVPVVEPFAKLMNQGQVLGRTPYRQPREGETLGVGEDGILVSFAEAATMDPEKLTWKWVRMSKSKGNVVTPDEAVAEFGADALRVYELFIAPFEANIQWSNEGMQGACRFLDRFIRLVGQLQAWYQPNWRLEIGGEAETEASRKIRRAVHKAIIKTTEDIEKFAFNTYISGLMIMVNDLNDILKGIQSPSPAESLAASEAIEMMILLLSPAAPHTCDELWTQLGRSGFVYHQTWPVGIAELAKDDLITIAVQVNGKLRDTLSLSPDTPAGEIEAMAKDSNKVKVFLEGVQIVKVIQVPGRLVNIVVK